MLISVPKEIKNHEYRVALTPSSVAELCARGHQVLVETGAGSGIGVADTVYQQAGAEIAADADACFARADMVVKVKEPQAVERAKLRPDQILFTYLHLAADLDQTKDLIASGATCIAYETVTSPSRGLPLLAPMSEVAGRLAAQAGAHFLERAHGGKGILPGGIPGVEPARMVIVGAGMVGLNAAAVGLGMGAEVVLIDRNPDALRAAIRQFGTAAKTVFSTATTLTEQVAAADILVGSVLIPGAAAPKLVTEEMIASMEAGSVAVDVAIDQGGCFATSRATTHDDPTYIVHDVVHYCVANMPGAVPRTSAYALSNATLPYVLALAEHRLDALRTDAHLRAGLNVMNGKLTHAAVAQALGLESIEAQAALGS